MSVNDILMDVRGGWVGGWVCSSGVDLFLLGGLRSAKDA